MPLSGKTTTSRSQCQHCPRLRPAGIAHTLLRQKEPHFARSSPHGFDQRQKDLAKVQRGWHDEGMPASARDSRFPSGGQWFATTHWSVVLSAGSSSTVGAQEALEALCCTYWYPLYAYVRRHGHSVEDAQDLTQEFFSRL